MLLASASAARASKGDAQQREGGGSGTVVVIALAWPAVPESSALHVAPLTICVFERLAELIDLFNKLFELSPFVLEQ